jgi:hypothetical protein
MRSRGTESPDPSWLHAEIGSDLRVKAPLSPDGPFEAERDRVFTSGYADSRFVSKPSVEDGRVGRHRPTRTVCPEIRG